MTPRLSGIRRHRFLRTSLAALALLIWRLSDSSATVIHRLSGSSSVRASARASWVIDRGHATPHPRRTTNH
jgi:hypothetical protein